MGKRMWILPAELRFKQADGREAVFDVFSRLAIDERPVTLACGERSNAGPLYSREEIELFLAQLRVAKMRASECYDKYINGLQAMLRDPVNCVGDDDGAAEAV